MRYPLLKVVSAVVAAGALALAGAAPALAAPEQPKPVSTLLGNDVSWPQCDSPLPRGAAFAVIGVTGGLAIDSNPCFAEQLAWAERVTTGATDQPSVALYVNTANPGHAAVWWPTADRTRQGTPVENPYGSCDGDQDAACSYVYGFSVALDDSTTRGVEDPSSYLWWLDVETMNTWQWDRGANRAVLEGMVDHFDGIGAEVGLYSTALQWMIIAGRPDEGSNLNGLPSWLAGASTAADARKRCESSEPLTEGGTVSMVQFIAKGLDYNVSC
jgi:hypothetical protein